MVDFQTYRHKCRALWVVLTVVLPLFLPLKTVFCSTNSDCIAIVYEPTICINEDVLFSLKTLGTCTIDQIKWNFGEDASIKEFEGPEPNSISFVAAGKQEVILNYYNHELKEEVNRIIPVEVIEPISEITINPTIPCVGQEIELTAEGPKIGFFVWKGGNLEEKISGDLAYKIFDELTKPTQTYTLEWYVGNGKGDGGCSYRKITKKIDANPLQTIQFEQGNSIQVCEGESVKIDIKNPSNIFYNWNCPENALIKAGNSIEFVPTESCEIKVTAFDDGCLKSGTINLHFQKIPQIKIYPQSSVICAGSSVELEVIGSIDGESYTWSDNDVFPQNTYANTVIVYPENTDNTYEATWHSGNCKATATAHIKVSDITDILDERTVNICEGENVTLQVARPNDGTVEWSGGDLPSIIPGEEITVSPEQTTMYTIVWKNDICSDTGAITVNVNPMPKFRLLSSVNDRICKGESVNIKAELSDASLNNNFTWYQSSNQQDITNHFNNLSFTAIESHTIVAEWVDTEKRCNHKITRSLYLEVIDRPESINLFSEQEEICFGDTVHFEITGANDASKYILLDDNETIHSDDLIDRFSLIPKETTTYTALWVDECETFSNTFKVKVNPNPNIEIETGEKICPKQNFQVKVLPDSYEYKWTGGDIETNTVVGGSTLTREADNNKHTYNLKVTNDYGCNLDTTVEINLIDIATNITTNQPQNEVCEGNAIKLSATGADSYSWQPAALLDNYLSNNPTAKPVDDFTRFFVTAYKDGCELTDSIDVVFKHGDDCEIDLNSLFIPNAITPNNDGKNDTWEIPEIDANPNYQVTIFNAAGAIIFDDPNNKEKFEGINGGRVPEGTYYYVITRKSDLAQRTGTLTIIR